MWEESWAQPLIQWLLTPALITGALLGLARLFDPPTRWARRLKSDISIMGGLPEGPERRVWQTSIEQQAMRLREYRRAFVGGTLIAKWLGLAFIGVAIFGLIFYPPINEPGDHYPFGPADYMFMALGLVATAAYTVSVASGNDFFGRSPRDILLIRRLRQFNRRARKLRRIQRERARRIAEGAPLRPRGSTLGFRTQIDEFGPWMRDSDMRALVRAAGWIAADHAGLYYRELRARGVEMPAWPDPETGRAPEPEPDAEPAPEPKGWRRWLSWAQRAR